MLSNPLKLSRVLVFSWLISSAGCRDSELAEPSVTPGMGAEEGSQVSAGPPATGAAPTLVELHDAGGADASTAGEPSLPCASSPDAGCPEAPRADASVANEDRSECEVLPRLFAHGGQTPEDEEGFSVPMQDDHYECFNFAIPWNRPMHAIGFFPRLDERRVVHHMILYALKTNAAPGSHGTCDGSGDRMLVGGWSPGQDDQTPFDQDLYGMVLPESSAGVFQLEIHYNNAGRIQARDRSGLEVCATSKLRARSLAMHLLGTFDIQLSAQSGSQNVVNACQVSSDKGPATVLAASPHMHKRGRHLRTVVRHVDGREEVITDAPYSFDDQAISFLPRPITIQKGDVITTTCTYVNDTGRALSYSQGQDGEMCQNVLIAYPPGSITGGLVGGLLDAVGVPNSCIGLSAQPLLGL